METECFSECWLLPTNPNSDLTQKNIMRKKVGVSFFYFDYYYIT
jgi:hypothetical protein